jgi:hypothetical protein
LVVEPGYILGPYGDDIVIAEEVVVDACAEDLDGNAVGPCGDVDPWCSPVRLSRDPERPLYLSVRYAECETAPVRVLGCGCDVEECAYTRVRDSFVVKLLDELPESHRGMTPPDWETVLSCPEGRPRGCPPCPEDPWVVLADVKVRGETIEDIDCASHRRHVVSFADLFYLCQARPANQPPTVTIDSPADGASLPTAHTTAIELAATATDPEDGVLTGNAVRWFDAHGAAAGAQLGTGEKLPTKLTWDPADAAAGRQTSHAIRVVATDSGGLSAADSISVLVGTTTVCHHVFAVFTANEAAYGSLVGVSPDDLRGGGRIDQFIDKFDPADMSTIEFTPGAATVTKSNLKVLTDQGFGDNVGALLTVYRKGMSNAALTERADEIVKALKGQWGIEVSPYYVEAPDGFTWPVECPFVTVVAANLPQIP